MIIKCRECCGEISNKASFCPHCGIKLQSSTAESAVGLFLLWPFFATGIVLLVSLVCGIFVNDTLKLYGFLVICALVIWVCCRLISYILRYVFCELFGEEKIRALEKKWKIRFF